jgi:hypothetical protein
VYYPITLYVLTITALIIAALLISSLYVLKFATTLKSNQAPFYIAFAIIASVLAFTTLELILHLIIQKHPISVAIFASLTFYLAVVSIFLAQLKLNLIACTTYTICGGAIFFASCLPIIIWLGCATGPVCI